MTCRRHGKGGREQNDHDRQVLKGGNFEICYNNRLFAFKKFTSRWRKKGIPVRNVLTINMIWQRHGMMGTEEVERGTWTLAA